MTELKKKMMKTERISKEGYFRKRLVELKIGEVETFYLSLDLTVLRVPGGWLMSATQINPDWTFIPLSELETLKQG